MNDKTNLFERFLEVCRLLVTGFLMFDTGNFINPTDFPSSQEGSPETVNFLEQYY